MGVDFFASPSEFKSLRLASFGSQDQLAKTAAFQLVCAREISRQKIANFFQNIKSMGSAFFLKADDMIKSFFNGFFNLLVEAPLLNLYFEGFTIQAIADMSAIAIWSYLLGLKHSYDAVLATKPGELPAFDSYRGKKHSMVLKSHSLKRVYRGYKHEAKYLQTKVAHPFYYEKGLNKGVEIYYNNRNTNNYFNIIESHIDSLPQTIKNEIKQDVAKELKPKIGAKTLLRMLKSYIDNPYGVLDVGKALWAFVKNEPLSTTKKIVSSLAGALSLLTVAVFRGFFSLLAVYIVSGFTWQGFKVIAVAFLLRATFNGTLLFGLKWILNKTVFQNTMYKYIREFHWKPKEKNQIDVFDDAADSYLDDKREKKQTEKKKKVLKKMLENEGSRSLDYGAKGVEYKPRIEVPYREEKNKRSRSAHFRPNMGY
jgi:hypothetical protein